MVFLQVLHKKVNIRILVFTGSFLLLHHDEIPSEYLENGGKHTDPHVQSRASLPASSLAQQFSSADC